MMEGLLQQEGVTTPSASTVELIHAKMADKMRQLVRRSLLASKTAARPMTAADLVVTDDGRE